MNILRKLFGMGPAADFADLMKQGAIVVDVRSVAEYTGGHIKGSLNIPIDQLRNNLKRLPDKNRTIITCCASGMRSASARQILKSSGYVNVHNGGGWETLQRKI